MSAKTNLLDLDQPQLVDFFTQRGERPFRARQVMKWVHHRGRRDFADMTDLAKALRTRLTEEAEIRPPDIAWEGRSADGTRKWVLELADGNQIETVFIPEPDRGTLCVSSQVGCTLNCRFCATARQGFSRNLTVAEIVGQIFIAAHALEDEGVPGRRVTNVVFMGMGEPLYNVDPVTRAARIMMDDLGYGLGKRRVTISTAGVVPAIDRLQDHADVSLAISLHAPDNALRDFLVPLNRKYPLETLLPACRRFVTGAPHKRITFEYVLLNEINDRLEHADRLIDRLADIPLKLNLIPFNPFPGAGFERSTDARIGRFQERLLAAGLTATVRRTRGDDIDAACGQLVGAVQDRSTRRQRWSALFPADSAPATGGPATHRPAASSEVGP